MGGQRPSPLLLHDYRLLRFQPRGLLSDSWEALKVAKGAEAQAGEGTGEQGQGVVIEVPQSLIHQPSRDNQGAQPAQDTDYSPGTVNTGNKSGKGLGRRCLGSRAGHPAWEGRGSPSIILRYAAI